MAKTDASTELMRALEEAKNTISMLSGLRQEFLNQGWPEEQAGLMVIEMMRLVGR